MLAGFLRNHKEEVVGRWAQMVVERLGLDSDTAPQLLNDLPDFIDELALCLRTAPDEWPATESARAHGEQRMEIGVDIGGLAEEFALVAEAILEVARERGNAVGASDAARLMRLVGRGAAASVREYARLWDRQLAEATARHFSFVAHELRTPLQTARLGLTLLADELGESEDLERVRRAHEELGDLVDNTLVQARLSGEPVLQVGRHDAGEAVAEALERVVLAARRRGIRLESDCPALALDVDRKLLVSALTNLLTNAVKFSREGSCVRVDVHEADERVLVEVRDACGGLPEELPARLFQPFVQASANRSGFGLGLMIVKQAVEAHGGAVRVVNHPGDGCSFVLELPRRASAEHRA